MFCNLCGLGKPGLFRTDNEPPDAGRRAWLRAGSVAATMPWALSSALAADATPVAAAAAPNAIAPTEALTRLMEGNARYAANEPQERDYSAGRAARALAQYPVAAILSCADSRVAPEFAFDQGPGELFITRVAGNYLTPSLMSSLEYGVAVLGAPLLMVLGHTNCGAVSAGVKSLEAKAPLPGHIQDIVTAMQPAVIKAMAGKEGSLLDRAIVENVKVQKLALATKPSLIKKMVDAKKIEIVGGVYDLATGKVTLV